MTGDLPKNPAITDRRYKALRSGSLLLSYLVLLRAGFALPSISLSRRCALALIPHKRAAPFHPYPEKSGRYIFCGTFRAGSVRPCGIPFRPSPLASTLPCGVRTFLSPVPASPDGIAALGRGSDRPASPRKPHDSSPSRWNQTAGFTPLRRPRSARFAAFSLRGLHLSPERISFCLAFLRQDGCALDASTDQRWRRIPKPANGERKCREANSN